ncbi:hypothetical protein BRD56_06250 [Thermoplasmatales archaeon SW_10_69_26]|nr:MAG: hypothetical protein BRD56_06250 [Thermoplasmatales archaeon SW_10_69_26]
METATVDLGSGTVHLIGVCQGLEGEAQAAVEAVEQRRPAVVAIALGPHMAEQVDEIVGAEALGAEDEAYMRGLSEWGSVTLPASTFPAVTDAAGRVDARVEGVDMPEAEYLEHHLDRIGIVQLLKRALRVRWLGWLPPDAESPAAFCRAFDRRVNDGPFGRLQGDRERWMADELADLARDDTVACVLEIERLDGVRQALQARDRPDR